MSDRSYFLGIDGGGSKTEAAVMDEDGRVLGVGLAGGSNTFFTPREEAEDNFTTAIVRAVEEASIKPEMICAAGSTFAAVAPASFSRLGITAALLRLGEASVAFERAGVEDKVGIALIAGTGSTCSGCNRRGERSHSGGWGAILGDDGGGYDIGRSAIRRVLWADEGRMPPTLLTRELQDYFGVTHPTEIIRMFVGGCVNQALAAGFAVRVSKAAQEGDEAAGDILRKAGGDLAQLALFVAGRVFSRDDEFPVVLAGGVFNAGETVVGVVRQAFTEDYPRSGIMTPRVGPGEAVAHIVRRTGVRRS